MKLIKQLFWPIYIHIEQWFVLRYAKRHSEYKRSLGLNNKYNQQSRIEVLNDSLKFEFIISEIENAKAQEKLFKLSSKSGRALIWKDSEFLYV